MLEALGAGRAIGQAHADHVLFAERLRGQERRERGIHPARQADDALLEIAAADDLVLQKTHQPLAR